MADKIAAVADMIVPEYVVQMAKHILDLDLGIVEVSIQLLGLELVVIGAEAETDSSAEAVAGSFAEVAIVEPVIQ